MRETTLNRGQGSTNFMKDVSMLILALEKLGVHIIFARIVTLFIPRRQCYKLGISVSQLYFDTYFTDYIYSTNNI
jgi:hypothetical protein